MKLEASLRSQEKKKLESLFFGTISGALVYSRTKNERESLIRESPESRQGELNGLMRI